MRYAVIAPGATHGRLVTLPDLSIHGHDLAMLLGRLIDFDGRVDESEINRRLAVVSDDAAQLRRLMVDATTNSDVPVVVGVSLFAALFYVTVNLVVDLLNSLIDPRTLAR